PGVPRRREGRGPRDPRRRRAPERVHGARARGCAGSDGGAPRRHGPAPPRSQGAPPAWAEGVVSGPDPAGATIRAKFRPARALMAAAKNPPSPPKRARSDRLARQLALGHLIERAIDSGQVASYADVARQLGLTESRIRQVTALVGLAPELQERVLIGEGGI